MSEGWRKYCSGERYIKQHRKASKIYYQKNKEAIIKRGRKRIRAWADWMLEYKAKRGCSRCEEKYPYCLGFHHRDNSLKESLISDLVRHGVNKKRILAEIEKCELLCANCHSKIHYPTYL